ncbi:ATP-binding protein [Solibacillus silvestris]
MSKIAQVISVLPDKIKIRVSDINKFKADSEKFAVGSYLRVSDHEDGALLCMIENFLIENKESNKNEDGKDDYILEAAPIGFIDINGEFTRGGNNIAIPPTGVELARKFEVQKIYDGMDSNIKFCFSKLLQDNQITVPVEGNKFFNKHIAIMGSTGSGKSHTVSTILQKAISEKKNNNFTLNNSHIVLFDIHSEYKTAFPKANFIDVDNLKLPYWLMNGEELEELFVESGENQSYNQSSVLRRVITLNKKVHNSNIKNITFDTPVKFSIREVINCITNLANETKNSKKPNIFCLKEDLKEFLEEDEKLKYYFNSVLEFEETKQGSINKGNYNDGSLEKFKSRITTKINDNRLAFLFGEESHNVSFEETLRNIIGYDTKKQSNITIIDLSGVPFEVLSITVSLISRMLFDFAYTYKKLMDVENGIQPLPLLVVYEEAHKYVPKVKSAKYNSSRIAIERIAKEGRKYGISLMIVSQRPSEISETIFSQCSNFVTMRLTNPDDQSYVKRLLPDIVGPITDSLPTLREGEAILIGEAINMPSLVKIDLCKPEPSSKNIEFLKEWKEPWFDFDISKVTDILKK